MTPVLHDLFAVIDATWPAASMRAVGPWCVRTGQGGGQRVSATTAADRVTDADIPMAEAAMAALKQSAIFMIRPQDSELDAWLAARGYPVVDPVNIYTIPSAELAQNTPPPVTCFNIAEPLAVMREIWAAGGIGPARLQVMQRAAGAQTYLFGRIDNRPAGCGFVAVHNGVAMLHALEITAAHQRKGLGRYIMWHAARWACAQGASWLSVICVRANQGANGLYKSIGMQMVGGYHYRRRD